MHGFELVNWYRTFLARRKAYLMVKRITYCPLKPELNFGGIHDGLLQPRSCLFYLTSFCRTTVLVLLTVVSFTTQQAFSSWILISKVNLLFNEMGDKRSILNWLYCMIECRLDDYYYYYYGYRRLIFNLRGVFSVDLKHIKERSWTFVTGWTLKRTRKLHRGLGCTIVPSLNLSNNCMTCGNDKTWPYQNNAISEDRITLKLK